jgi:hypothetical protein
MHEYMLNPIGLRNNCAMQMPLQKKLKLFVSGIVSHRHGDIYMGLDKPQCDKRVQTSSVRGSNNLAIYTELSIYLF